MRSSPNFASLEEAPISGPTGTAGVQGIAANGRIDLLSPMPDFHIRSPAPLSGPGVSGSASATGCDTGFFKQALPSQVRSDLSDLFFSDTNISALQEGIRYRIYTETNGQYVIGRQSDTELKIIMRSIFYQHAKNIPTDIVGQVRDLNGKVLEWAVPEVLSNLKQHIVYLRDASTLPMPLEHAQKVTSKGTRTLEFKTFF